MMIAYITNCFGTQSHTFMRREITALRQLGLKIALYGIHQDKNIEGDAQLFVDETEYLYPLKAFDVVKSNAHYFFGSPIHYLAGIIRALFSQEFTLKRRLKMLYHYFISADAARRMEQASITHIHAHFMNVSASIAMYASHHSKIPFSVTVHSAGTYKTPHILGVHQKLQQSQFLMMISHYNIKYFNAISPCEHKAHVVRCGMDLDNFKYRPSSDKPMRSPIHLLAVGRFVEKKGFQYLIEAAGILKQKSIAYRLSIIGAGPLDQTLRQRVLELGLSEHVVFTGQKNSEYVKTAMMDADIVIVPSVTSASGEKEGLPVVIMEAMATGTPVIASDHSGISEIVQHGETGILTAEKDSAAIAQAITNIADQHDSRMVEAAEALVKQEFNINSVAKKRLELFEHYRLDK